MTDYSEPPTQINYPIDETKEEALARLGHLWKTDDPEWLAQRQKEWCQLSSTVYDNYPKSEKKLFERYYIYGEYTKYFSRCVLPLTPYTTPEELMSIFNSRFFDYRDRQFCFTEYVFDSGKFDDMPWFRKQLEIFINNFLVNGYFVISEHKSPGELVDVSPSPTIWAAFFVKCAVSSINNKVRWHPVYDCIKYFISILNFAVDDKDRKLVRLNKLWGCVDLYADDIDLPAASKDFIEALKANKEEIIRIWGLGKK